MFKLIDKEKTQFYPKNYCLTGPMLPSYPDISTTPLQEATLQAVEALIKVSHSFPHYVRMIYVLS